MISTFRGIFHWICSVWSANRLLHSTNDYYSIHLFVERKPIETNCAPCIFRCIYSCQLTNVREKLINQLHILWMEHDNSCFSFKMNDNNWHFYDATAFWYAQMGIPLEFVAFKSCFHLIRCRNEKNGLKKKKKHFYGCSGNIVYIFMNDLLSNRFNRFKCTVKKNAASNCMSISMEKKKCSRHKHLISH